MDFCGILFGKVHAGDLFQIILNADPRGVPGMENECGSEVRNTHAVGIGVHPGVELVDMLVHDQVERVQVQCRRNGDRNLGTDRERGDQEHYRGGESGCAHRG